LETQKVDVFAAEGLEVIVEGTDPLTGKKAMGKVVLRKRG
jgi:hypothetical protein